MRRPITNLAGEPAILRPRALDLGNGLHIKMAMGLRMAQANGSAYTAAHLQRFLEGTDRGRSMLKALAAEDLVNLKPADRLAIRYAELLTKTIHVTDDDFRAVRGYR
jgi:hypothetical protein